MPPVPQSLLDMTGDRQALEACIQGYARACVELEIAKRADDFERAEPADIGLLRLITDLRWALGDEGGRMQPELLEYARELKAKADAWDRAQVAPDDLPTLPEPEGVIVVNTHAMRAFTADQMRVYGRVRVELDRARRAQVAAPVAWLHTVRVCNGEPGETDQELSFAPDSFQLGDAGLFESIRAQPLYAEAPPAAPVELTDARDAQRYRWLRAGKARTTGLPKPGRLEVCRWEDRSEGSILKGEALDAAIDRAILAAADIPKDNS